jgi:hypothetical protein
MFVDQVSRKICSFLLMAAVITSAFSNTSCGFSEEQKSLYNQEALRFKPVTITVQTKIEPTIVEPSLPRQWCRRFLSWIPGMCNLFGLPLNIVRALIPPLPFKDRTGVEVPDNVPWTDPQILPYIKTVTLTKGFIRVIPENERGPFYKKERCLFLCGKEELTFLQEIAVNLVFSPKKLRECRKKAKQVGSHCRGLPDCGKEAEVMDKACMEEHEKNVKAGLEQPQKIVSIAKAITKDDYDKKAKVMTFKMTSDNLRPYLEDFSDFEVDIKAKGKFPKRTTYVDGGLTLEFLVQLPDPY